MFASSPPKFNFRPCRGWLWRELVVEDRNERGQAVVAFVISTPEDCIQRLLGGETVRFECKKFRVKCRWATDTQTSWTFRFFQACVYTYTYTRVHGLNTVGNRRLSRLCIAASRATRLSNEDAARINANKLARLMNSIRGLGCLNGRIPLIRFV